MIAGWLSRNEGKFLAHFAKRTKGAIVEIGSFQGKSTVAMARVTKQQIYAIDPHYLHSHTKFLQNIKRYKNIIPVKKTSAAAAKNWKLPIALLHIDGAHEYKFAKEDLRLWLPHLEKDGVVICHDAFCPYPEVWQAIREEIFDPSTSLRTSKSFGYIGVLDSQVFAIRGKRQLNWQRPFIILASNIWHISWLPEALRFIIVNRLLKPFFLNRFMFRAMFDRLKG